MPARADEVEREAECYIVDAYLLGGKKQAVCVLAVAVPLSSKERG